MKHVKLIRQLFIVVFLMSCLDIHAADDSDLITKRITITLSEAGTLPDKIGTNKKYRITNLKIVGKINSTDWQLLRDMAGNDYYFNDTDGKLSTLDLSEAEIVGGGGICYKNGGRQFDNHIATFAFYGCHALQNLTLPLTIIYIGNKAFHICI